MTLNNNVSKNSSFENLMSYEMKQEADIQCILKSVEPFELMKKISNFRKLNIQTMTDSQISKEILNVLCNNGIFSCYTNIKNYPAGTKFFRVKKFVGSNIPNERFKEYQDYWETNPAYLTTYGRLNKPGESLLYASADLSCSIGEMRINKNDYFAVIQYTARRQIKVNMIGGEFDYDAMGIKDEKVKLVHEMYNSFLRDEFSRDVGIGTEYLYKVSEKIAKDHFDLPPKLVQDAWAYTSVKDKNKYNICFRPDLAHELLELNGAMVCKLDENNRLRVYCVAVGKDEYDKILFYRIGSDVQKEVFPEICALDMKGEDAIENS